MGLTPLRYDPEGAVLTKTKADLRAALRHALDLTIRAAREMDPKLRAGLIADLEADFPGALDHLEPGDRERLRGRR